MSKERRIKQLHRRLDQEAREYEIQEQQRRAFKPKPLVAMIQHHCREVLPREK